MQITLDQLKKICPFAPRGFDAYVPYLNKFMPMYGIDTIDKVRAFIAQVAHESGSFRYTSELASGKDYEGRKDLGNIHPGDGVKFKGHGLIQITGRSNHLECGKALGIDLINTPLLLTTPKYAVQSACWFWQKRKLNEIAERNKDGWFIDITKKINGGLNGLRDRQEFWERAMKAIV
ncbi:glycoside hydrolase family 19 protein [Taibaiella lutea]|uniref:Glycoside hydrolase family 19 protein n=1 Tax=Taibaiella lutea TaxID=2608001 RepID=A0A5M6CFQ7_9BACT|nr:glycoside hydrolase family 19 protein [Taibaiella lutea]